MAYPKLAINTTIGPVRTSGLLLNAISTSPELEQMGGDRWMHGVSWNPQPTRDPIVADIDTCSPANFGTGADGRGCQAAISQVAFQMFDAFDDTLMDYGPDAASLFDEILMGRFDLWRSWAFARALMGTATVTNARTLASTAAAPGGVPFGSAATPIWNALAILESHLARKIQNGQGILHIAPGLLAQAVDSYALIREGGNWYTPLGNLVVADGGYVDPLKPTAAGAVPAGTDWAYCSGPVWYAAHDPQLLGDSWQSTDITSDKVKRWLDSYGILIFDPAPVAAVLVSYAKEG
mgnify:CR=1 FL=1